MFLSWLPTLLMSYDHLTIPGPPTKMRLYTKSCCWCFGSIICSSLLTILNLRWPKGDFTQCFVVALWLFDGLRSRCQFCSCEERKLEDARGRPSRGLQFIKKKTWPFYNFRYPKGDFEKRWALNNWERYTIYRLHKLHWRIDLYWLTFNNDNIKSVSPRITPLGHWLLPTVTYPTSYSASAWQQQRVEMNWYYKVER